MNLIRSAKTILLPRVADNHAEGFARDKFRKNNFRIVLLSGFLFFEQLFYAVFVSPPWSELRRVYFISSAVMLAFFIVGLVLSKHGRGRITFLHEFHEVSFGFFGMAVACLRFIFIEFDAETFRIPTVYIAVLYGTAVIFVYKPWQCVLMYIATGTAAAVLMPVFHPEIAVSSYIADITSNGIIAFMMSAINYRNFVINYRNKRLIEEQNNDLVSKNDRIRMINDELKELSEKDHLTGLFNRRKVTDDMMNIFRQAKRYDRLFSIMIMDIDHFKQINDTYGHDAGDKVLIDIACILESNIRDVDICGRWGGEEFIIVCPDINHDGALALAERLRKDIGSYTFGDLRQITASFGVSTSSFHEDIASVVKSADMHLYKAKEAGRNRVIGEDTAADKDASVES